MTGAILIAGSALAIAIASGYAASAGAQAKPAAKLAFEITERRNEAAAFALTHALVIESLLKNCARLETGPLRDPDQALLAWQERNRDRLEAAHGYLFYVRAVTSSREGNAAAEAFYKRTLDELSQRANLALSEIFSQRDPSAAACAKWTASILQGKADLNWKPQYIHVLDEIVAFHRSVVGKP